MAMISCKFCGQMIEGPENAEEGYAELHCSCARAKAFQISREQMERAEATIEMIFGPCSNNVTAYGQKPINEEQRKILLRGCEMLTDGICDKIQISFNGVCSARLKISGNGEISISRTETRSVTEKV